jgi:tRNA A-37 threonylcarbamoyl transferase component Bud32
VHLDATLKNFVIDGTQMKVIDFEYYAGKKEFTLKEQKAYDYVRIIEHSLRNIPKENQENYHEFVEYLDKIVPKEIRSVDFKYVKPLLSNIDSYPIYKSLKEKIFTKLIF